MFFDYSRQSVFVNHDYFYLQDEDFGPAFIKVCTYAPYAVKICLNGHEWAKRQLRKQDIAFEALDNGFLSCEDPQELQTQHPEILWRNIIGMRHILVHHDFEMDLDIVWTTVERDLPLLKQAAETILAELDAQR